MLHGCATDFEAVAGGMLALRQRIDDHTDPAALNHLDDIRAALVHLADQLDINAELRNRL